MRAYAAAAAGGNSAGGRNYYRTYRGLYGLLHAAETQEENQEEREFWETCRNPERVKTTVEDGFGRARLNLLWSNRLLETRAAMMEQLAQTADIMRNAARSIYDIRRLDGVKRYQVETGLRTHGLQMRDAWIYTRDDEWFELYLTLRTGRWSRCIPVKEAAWWLSGYFGQDLAPAYDSRMIINREFCTVCFTPEPEYVMLCGVARATREGEVISGDSFSMFRRDNGQMILGISDGMGSGPGACRESEQVIELLEQFLEAGFGKETAVRMIHAALMLQNNGSFSSVDLCTVNLFDGSCEFLKIRGVHHLSEKGGLGGGHCIHQRAYRNHGRGGFRLCPEAAFAGGLCDNGIGRRSGRHAGTGRRRADERADPRTGKRRCRRDCRKSSGSGAESEGEPAGG